MRARDQAGSRHKESTRRSGSFQVGEGEDALLLYLYTSLYLSHHISHCTLYCSKDSPGDGMQAAGLSVMFSR